MKRSEFIKYQLKMCEFKQLSGCPYPLSAFTIRTREYFKCIACERCLHSLPYKVDLHRLCFKCYYYLSTGTLDTLTMTNMEEDVEGLLI